MPGRIPSSSVGVTSRSPPPPPPPPPPPKPPPPPSPLPPFPPIDGPRRPFRHEALGREQQRIVRLGYLGLSGRLFETVALRGLVPIGLVRLGRGDHHRWLCAGQLAYCHTGPAVAHFHAEYGIAGCRERRYQFGDILVRFRQTQLRQGPRQPSEVAVEEGDASVADADRFDEAE